MFFNKNILLLKFLTCILKTHISMTLVISLNTSIAGLDRERTLFNIIMLDSFSVFFFFVIKVSDKIREKNCELESTLYCYKN